MTVTTETKKPYYTTYAEAIKWLGNSYILCNNIVDIDNSVYDNMRFSDYDEETDSYTEIYQWFISDCSKDEVEYLERNFGLLFTHSDLLDKYILCVDHYGTSWDYVHCQVLTYGNEDGMYPRIKSYKELTGQEF